MVLLTPQQTLDSFISKINKCAGVTTGASRKCLKKKAVITKLPWREYENLLFETVDVFRFHEDQRLIRGTSRVVRERDVSAL